jgi:hypothetical protein
VSQPDPEDDGRATGPSGRSPTFEEIIANERAAGWDPKIPDISKPPEDTVGAVGTVEPPTTGPPAASPTTPIASPDFPDPDDNEHYVPPEPPPMPRIGLAALVGLVLISLGVVLLAVPGVFGLSYGTGLPLGLMTLAVGLGWLIHRAVRTTPNDADDGSVL